MSQRHNTNNKKNSASIDLLRFWYWPPENSRSTLLLTWNSVYGQTYSPHTHVQAQRRTYKHGVNEARFSSVMTPVLAWQDVYTHNHGRASDVGWDEGEMRGEEKRGGRDVTMSVGYGLLFSVWQEDSCNRTPLRAERERDGERLRGIDRRQRGRTMNLQENVLKRKEFFFFRFLLRCLLTQPRSPIRRKTIRSTRFPLARSVDYKWANLAFITSLQTFIKAGSPLKLQR